MDLLIESVVLKIFWVIDEFTRNTTGQQQLIRKPSCHCRSGSPISIKSPVNEMTFPIRSNIGKPFHVVGNKQIDCRIVSLQRSAETEQQQGLLEILVVLFISGNRALVLEQCSGAKCVAQHPPNFKGDHKWCHLRVESIIDSVRPPRDTPPQVAGFYRHL